MKAVILAGGLGTRLRPLTDNTPKPLLPISGKPILEHAILNFKKHGIEEIVLSIGYLADKIQDYFGNGEKWGVKISYAIEVEPLGTGGAIKQAIAGITETFVAINGDNLADFNWTEAIAKHHQNKDLITLSLYPVSDVTQFGIAKLDGEKIIGFIEKPKVEEAPSNLNNAGGYIIEPRALEILPAGKSSIEKDCFEKLAPTGVIGAYIHEGQWYPTDTLEKYTWADKNFIPVN